MKVIFYSELPIRATLPGVPVGNAGGLISDAFQDAVATATTTFVAWCVAFEIIDDKGEVVRYWEKSA